MQNNTIQHSHSSESRSCVRPRPSMPLIGVVTMLMSIFATRLAEPARAQAWSPDGQQIAIGGASLLVADARSFGAAVAPIAPKPGIVVPPLLATAANPLITVPGVSAAYGPTWSRNGGQIAYVTEGTGLTLFDITRRDNRPVVKGAICPAAVAHDINLFSVLQKSESGKVQALIRYVNNQVFLPPIDLPFHSAPTSFVPIGFVANTANAIVSGGDNGKNDLYLLDQSEVVQLTTTGDVLGFAVSADGSRVRWVRASPNTRYILLQVYELAIDTRSLKKLPFPDRIAAINPNPRYAPTSISSIVFSPDLNRFVFVAHGGPQAAANGTALWITDITGADVHFVGSGTPVTAPATSVPISAQQLTGTSFPYYVPSFSPDNGSLAAVRVENGKRYLFVGSAATGQGKGTVIP